MNKNLKGQQFIEKACLELLKAGIQTFNYEREDCDFAIGYQVDIIDDLDSNHRVVVNIERSFDIVSIIIGMPPIKLDQDDVNALFVRKNNYDFSKYTRLIDNYFTTRDHLFNNRIEQSDPTDPYSKISGIRFALVINREFGSRIFYDEDSITIMEYLNRLSYLGNDIVSLLTATIVGFGDFERMYKNIFEKYHLEK